MQVLKSLSEYGAVKATARVTQFRVLNQDRLKRLGRDKRSHLHLLECYALGALVSSVVFRQLGHLVDENLIPESLTKEVFRYLLSDFVSEIHAFLSFTFDDLPLPVDVVDEVLVGHRMLGCVGVL